MRRQISAQDKGSYFGTWLAQQNGHFGSSQKQFSELYNKRYECLKGEIESTLVWMLEGFNFRWFNDQVSLWRDEGFCLFFGEIIKPPTVTSKI